MTEVFIMGPLIRTENYQIVKVYKHEGNTSKNTIHKTLERGGGITDPVGHHGKLKISKGSYDGCLWDGIFGQGDLIVGLLEINYRKNFGSRHICSKVSQKR